MKRKIAAILAADIAGYSRLVAEDEEETLRRLAVYKGVLEDFVSRANGRIFNTAGDGFLAEFPSAVDAVRCAIDAQESLRTRNLAYPPSRHMAFRMGLTIGDVVDRDGDLLGDGVNIAARLQTLAEPGRICISKSVYDSVANKLSVHFTDLGPQQVKNIPMPVHVYGVATGSAAAAPPAAEAPPRPRASSGLGPVPLSVAIIAALLIGAAVAMFSTGILGPPETRTASSSTASKPATDKPQEVAKSSPAPEKSTAPAAAPAAEPVAGPNEPVPAPSEVASTETPQAAVTNDDVASLSRLRPRWWSECKGDDAETAATACRRLIGEGGIAGSDLALAHERLAFAERRAGQIDEAIASFTRSIDIAESSEAYNERGTAYFLKGQLSDAMTDYDRAIALDGNNGDAFNNRAWANYKLGKIDAAKADADRAQSLLPNKADVWDTRGHILEALGNRTEAAKSFEKALAIDPTLESSKTGLRRLGVQ